jgi:hypothetical protein
MPGQYPDGNPRLEASLERISRALEQSRSSYAPIVSELVRTAGSELSYHLAETRAERRASRAARRARRRALRRLARERTDTRVGSFLRGAVLAVAAIAAYRFSASGGMFWMMFVALGFALGSVKALGSALSSRKQLPSHEDELDDELSLAEDRAHAATPVARSAPAAPPVPPAPEDPKVARIQRLCERLLVEVQSGPAVFRDVIREPEKTIAGLRQACLAIALRERELREALATKDDLELASERLHLQERISHESDGVVRERLGAALHALETQLAHRAEVATAASRLEAENTRILYTLESLNMQVLRARSTDAGAPELGGGLRRSFEDLTLEIDAVAEALEWTEPGAAVTSRAEPSPDDAARAAVAQDEARRAAAAAQARRGQTS